MNCDHIIHLIVIPSGSQGKDALIAKFRSSSVMDEVLAFRPRLFHSSGPFQGSPEAFPGMSSNDDNFITLLSC